MEAHIFLYQMQIMFGNVKLVSILIFNDQMLDGLFIDLQMGQPQEFSDAMNVMDDIITLLNIDKIVQRRFGRERCLS